MKILLVGPYPPPHGGISVHIYEVRRQLQMAGIHCRVVNVDPRAPESAEYICVRGGLGLFLKLTEFAGRGWTLHVHTNGHNLKSWLIALTAGIAGLFGHGNVLTLHSGLVPERLAPGRRGPRLLARFSCLFYRRVIAVSQAVQDAVISVGVPAKRVELLPSFIFTKPGAAERFLTNRSPILGTTLFFRPEYGFHLLVEAVGRLREKYPGIACLVMGSGEQQAQAEQLVAGRGLQTSICFLGNVEHARCLSIMSQCDLFVRPALADGDANCVREALALGIPVVASRVGTRPPGTILFQTGNVDDLVLKMEEACSSQPVRRSSAGGASEGHIRNLIGIYSSI
jgi:glycosyltransferase involved in cell wall biosynthesis